jgi:hypothetical protein
MKRHRVIHRRKGVTVRSSWKQVKKDARTVGRGAGKEVHSVAKWLRKK